MSVNTTMDNLPHNIEAEQAVLGAVLVNNDAMHRITDLEVGHFFDPVHQRIFGVISEKVSAGELASPITLKFALENDEGLKELGGARYLVRLAGASISLSAVADFASVLIELAQRRIIVESAYEAINRAGVADGGSVDDIRADLEEQLAATYILNKKNSPFASFSQSVVSAIDAANEAYKGEAPRGMQTGLKSIDGHLGSFKPGQIYVIAGRPSMGKTAIALNISSRTRGGVVFASLEMTDESLANRVISQRLCESGTKIPYRNIENGWMDEGQFRQVIKCSQDLLGTNMVTIKPGNGELSKLLSAVRSAARQIKKKTNLEMIVVDFLQLITVRGMKSFEAIGEATRAFKALALQYDVPVILLSQLNRQVELRDNKRPTLSDLRGSGEIEEHGDVIIFCYRHAYYLEREIEAITDQIEKTEAMADLAAIKNDLELIVAKNKGGKIGTIHLGCEVKFNHIYDKDKQMENPF